MAAQNIDIINRLLASIENDIVPLTQKGVEAGNKVFGAAILRKSDLSLVVAATNTEIQNPLWHGEVCAINKLYEMPLSERPSPRDCIFLASHQPCSLCLSAITWGGYDNFYYLFSYSDSRDTFNIPHDLKILKEVFKCDHGDYARDNFYWKSYSLLSLIEACDEVHKQAFLKRVDCLKKIYSEMSGIYQQGKNTRDIPLS
jgi:tRNA(Arg) A34 adenosine deaminase TadA